LIKIHNKKVILSIGHMKQKKFSTFIEAVSYCESKGKMKFIGRIGQKYEYALYNLYIENRVYTLEIREDGLLRVRDKRLKLDNE